MSFSFDTTITLPLVVSVLTLAFAWWRTRRSAVDDLFRAGRKRMDDHDRRLQALEQDMQALPTTRELHAIELTMTRMSGQLETVGAHIQGQKDVMKRLESIVTRHEEHLISGSGK